MGRFRIKITPWWASNDWVQFKYSTNGIIWRKIHTLEYDYIVQWYFMVPLKISFQNAEQYINKFSSIEAIREYERIEREKCDYQNNIIEQGNKMKAAERKSIYNRFG